jgi:hypothetical protein
MSEQGTWRRTLIWAALLAGPIGWFVSLEVLFYLTRPVCESGDRTSMAIVSATAASLAAIGFVAAVGVRKRNAAGMEAALTFLAHLSLWGNPIFLLVILLSAIPVFLLSPCGV